MGKKKEYKYVSDFITETFSNKVWYTKNTLPPEYESLTTTWALLHKSYDQAQVLQT